MVLYLASTNPGKLREFREAAAERGIRVEPLPGIGTLPPCVEDGATFEENARKKALHYSAYVEEPVFADDSGLSVDALGGAPGIYSARFAALKEAGRSSARPPQLSPEGSATARETVPRAAAALETTAGLGVDAANNRRLIEELCDVPPDLWKAHYVCVIALAQRGRVLKLMEGRVEGLIIGTPRGRSGFGYDPHFFYPPIGKTFAELTPEEKFAVSHRGQAFRKLLDELGVE